MPIKHKHDDQGDETTAPGRCQLLSEMAKHDEGGAENNSRVVMIESARLARLNFNLFQKRNSNKEPLR